MKDRRKYYHNVREGESPKENLFFKNLGPVSMIHSSEDESKAKQIHELFLGSKVSIIFRAYFLGIWISVTDKQGDKLRRKKSEM